MTTENRTILKKTLIASLALLSVMQTSAFAESSADLNDLEIAHVAYTTDSIDIRYAYLALAISKNTAVHEFARTMIRDHGAAFDRRYAENELGYEGP